MVDVFYPPKFPVRKEPSINAVKVFLAGTIDMGASLDWQALLIKELTDKYAHCHLDIYNPRREDWDNTWKPIPSNIHFRKQVEWELEQLERADVIVMVFMPGSKSPISLLELGLFKDKTIIVYNPEDFSRWGNVQITCKRYKVPVYNDWDVFKHELKRTITYQILKKA